VRAWKREANEYIEQESGRCADTRDTARLALLCEVVELLAKAWELDILTSRNHSQRPDVDAHLMRLREMWRLFEKLPESELRGSSKLSMLEGDLEKLLKRLEQEGKDDVEG
jgi:hypothetical protein